MITKRLATWNAAIPQTTRLLKERKDKAMQYARSTSIVLAVALAHAALAATSFGQDQKNREQRLAQAKKELDELKEELKFKPGAEVMALRDAELRVETKTVGTVPKGEKLSVEQVQDKWLWVRSGETRGWIQSGSVLDARLFRWYQRLPNSESVEARGGTRAKFRGVLFEIHSAGSKGLMVNFDVNYADPCTIVFYRKVMVFVEGRDDGRVALYLNFDHSGALVGSPPYPVAFKGSGYATVAPGDYVFISAVARQVFVNGELRRPSR